MQKKTSEFYNLLIRSTKNYILEILNATFFTNRVTLEGVDLFHELPILNRVETPGGETEQRGALLLCDKDLIGYRVLVSIQKDHHWSVCYRIKNLKDPVSVESGGQSNRMYFPFQTILDLSVSDGTVGVYNTSVRSFSLNSDHVSEKVIIKFVNFLLESTVTMYDNKEVFQDMVDSDLSFVPYPGDDHYKQIYAVPEC